MTNPKPLRRSPRSAARLRLAAGLLAVAAAGAALAQTPSGVGAVTHLSGTLVVRKADGAMRFLSVKSQIGEGDTLSTERGTYARIKFSDGAEVVLRPQSQIKVDAYQYDAAQPERDNVLVSLFKGGLRSVTGLIGRRNRNKVLVSSPTATVGIRGTHFGMLFCSNDCASIPTASGQPPPNGLHVDVTDGAIAVRNNAGQQIINAGQFGYVRDTVSAPAAVPAAQGVQVTMPLAISRNAGAGSTLGKERQDNQCVVP